MAPQGRQPPESQRRRLRQPAQDMGRFPASGTAEELDRDDETPPHPRSPDLSDSVMCDVEACGGGSFKLEEKIDEKTKRKNTEFTLPNKNGGRELTQPHTSHCVTHRSTPCHTACRLSLTPKSCQPNWAVLIVVAQSPPIHGAGRFPTCGPAAEPQLQGYGRAEWCVAQYHQIGVHARGVGARTGLGARVLGCK